MAELFEDTISDQCNAQLSRLSVGGTRRAGDWAELTACTFLMEEGFDVFKNVCAVGPVDLVAMKDGKIRLFDVKLVTVYLKGNRHVMGCGKRPKRENQLRKGIEILYVSQHGICTYSSRALAAKYKLLTGCESEYNFWNGGRTKMANREVVDLSPELG